jgi:hypothetical protein
VLNAEASVLNQRRLGADLKARALDVQIGLIRALGGGYVERAIETATAMAAAPLPEESIKELVARSAAESGRSARGLHHAVRKALGDKRFVRSGEGFALRGSS